MTWADSAAVNRFGGEPTSSAAIAIMGGFSRKGAWVVPAKFTAVAIMAGGELDLREARFAERVVRIHATAIMGGIAIIVPDDAEVHVTGIGLMGAFEHGPTGTGQPGAPKILISGLAFWGAVDVQRKPPTDEIKRQKLEKQAPETGVEESARALTGPHRITGPCRYRPVARSRYSPVIGRMASLGPDREADRMRLGMLLNYAGGFAETVVELADYEKAGLDIVWVAEAYGFDAYRSGYIAAKTERSRSGRASCSLLPHARAAGPDRGRPRRLQEGRSCSASGASGPQVIEGFHGVPSTCRRPHPGDHRDLPQVWRRERWCTTASSRCRCRRAGHRPGQAAQADQPPGPRAIPIYVAAMGPQNVELDRGVADGWLPFLFVPEKAGAVWGAARRGRAKRSRRSGRWRSPAGRWPSART